MQKKNNVWWASIPVIVLLGLFIWLFSDIVAYILLAAALSFIGHPIVRFLDKIRVGSIKLPHTLSSVLTLLFIIGITATALAFIFPVVSSQAKVISQIDYAALREGLVQPLFSIESFMYRVNMLQPGENLNQIITDKLVSLTQAIDVSVLLNKLLGIAGSVFIGIFSVLFVTFFFLKDDKLFLKTVLLIFPDKYAPNLETALNDILRLLSRYFVGLSIEVITMMTLISIGGFFLGLENAILIGVIGGIFNIIPYLGPLIGAVIGALLVITTNISPSAVQETLWLSLGIIGVFVGSNLIDNLVLQPLIYSASIKAHPLEIFLVIMIAGSIAGIAGMILAIPAYTIFRVIGRQFFNQYHIIRKISAER
jgi:predicted PurR-regulated permease PerM